MSPLRFTMRSDTTPASTQPPIATVTVYTQLDTITPTPSAHPAGRDMPSVMIIGLAMIPLVIFLVGLCILFIYWSRKRRAVQKLHHAPRKPPPVPEKDLRSHKNSIASRRGSSKVFHMKAFSAPMERDGRREAQFSRPVALQTMDATENKSRNVEPLKLASSNENQGVLDADLESPIDGSMPFRLKRGDTVKRHSLGTDLAKYWPSPPPSARLKTDYSLYPPVQWKPPVYHR
ncbi:hypothetical protein HBH96_184780 [Parastagonospora nodorum]|nr:hypothetical protein HBH96_184780 [Parastagonospora nodorum]KAH5678549.1 hypothetical protein HBI21_091910 [Parastagonospora nodorum]